MSLYMGQWGVSTGTIATFNIPPGVYNITMYNISTLATIYMALGTSPTVAPNLTITNGLQLHSIPTTWNGYQGERGGTMWLLNTLATSTVPVNYILSTQEQ
jgi:hypothetical protein